MEITFLDKRTKPVKLASVSTGTWFVYADTPQTSGIWFKTDRFYDGSARLCVDYTGKTRAISNNQEVIPLEEQSRLTLVLA